MTISSLLVAAKLSAKDMILVLKGLKKLRDLARKDEIADSEADAILRNLLGAAANLSDEQIDAWISEIELVEQKHTATKKTLRTRQLLKKAKDGRAKLMTVQPKGRRKSARKRISKSSGKKRQRIGKRSSKATGRKVRKSSKRSVRKATRSARRSSRTRKK